MGKIFCSRLLNESATQDHVPIHTSTSGVFSYATQTQFRPHPVHLRDVHSSTALSRIRPFELRESDTRVVVVQVRRRKYTVNTLILLYGAPCRILLAVYTRVNNSDGFNGECALFELYRRTFPFRQPRATKVNQAYGL